MQKQMRSQPPPQPPPLESYNLFATDLTLRVAVKRESLGEHEDLLSRVGAELGRAELAEHARLANRHVPQLHRLDPRGERIDRINFIPRGTCSCRASPRAVFTAGPGPAAA